MSDRGQQLQATADQQIASMIDLIGGLEDAGLRRPCPGREKLGDGTIGALAVHTAENYQRIASFVAAQVGEGHASGDGEAHRPIGHGHADRYTAANTTPVDLVNRLSIARGRLSRIAELADDQLDSVPDKDSFRFCDGQRTLEQVLNGLLKHQGRQVQLLMGPAL
jgi:hypothetical protein